jgi:Sulfotransferase family
VVCEPRKFLYMKAAKNAGTSILRGHLEKEVSGVIHLKDHPEAFQRWLAGITDEALEEYYIFSVVRNPWDRLVSLSAYLNIPHSQFIAQFDHFQQFERVRVHSLPQHLYTHCSGQLFVNRMCRFESVQDDMDLVLKELNLKPAKMPFINRSKHGHYASYYSDSERDKVASLYADEIALYGYTFTQEGDG